MKLDVKLDHFYQSVINDATLKSEKIINDYKESLDKIYENQKEDALRKARVSLRVETDDLIRQKNKTLTAESLNIRRDITKKNAELKDKLFIDIEEKLKQYMTTTDYNDLLINQIQAAIKFARKEPITIYINPSDADKQKELEAKTGVELTISNQEFLGGTRAVIHSKNILIDNSFKTKLAEEKDIFRF